MNHSKNVITRQSALMTRLCFTLLGLLLFGCAGRAESTIEYYPPDQVAREMQVFADTDVIIAGNINQAKAAVTKFLQSIFPEQLDSTIDGNTFVVMAAISPDKMERFLDCGRLSILNPDTQKEPVTFAATERQRNFLLSDATSFPKPAQRNMGAVIKISLLFTRDGPNKTKISLQTIFSIRQELSHYTLVQGFSPMMPYRLSQLVKEDDIFVFDSGTTGQSTTILPKMRYCINGSFKIRCVSTGSLENELIQGIKNIKINKINRDG